MTTTDPDTERGLYGKYRVERVDGKNKGPYFVLGYTTDPHAAVALAAYAKSCEDDYPKLAADLREALRGQPECECDEPACQWCETHGDTGNPTACGSSSSGGSHFWIDSGGGVDVCQFCGDERPTG